MAEHLGCSCFVREALCSQQRLQVTLLIGVSGLDVPMTCHTTLAALVHAVLRQELHGPLHGIGFSLVVRLAGLWTFRCDCFIDMPFFLRASVGRTYGASCNRCCSQEPICRAVWQVREPFTQAVQLFAAST